MTNKKLYDFGNVFIIAITFILFAVALFTTGFTKDLLLEAGVLLVSIKIILMNRTTRTTNMEISKKLDEINEKLNNLKSKDN